MYPLISPRLLKLLLLLLLLPGCGTKSGPTYSVLILPADTQTTQSLPTDTAIADIVFLARSEAPNENVLDSNGSLVIAKGVILDENRDTLPDTVTFPTACGATLPANCGFARSVATFDLDGLPLNYRYTLTVQFRGTNGVPLYEGTSTSFNNLHEAASQIQIAVAKSAGNT